LVVSGFEPLDVLQSIMMILQQLRQGRASIENQYGRVVPWDGNQPALRAMKDVFELRALFEWRGLGMIAESTFKLRPEYADFDAEVRFSVPNVRISDPQGAQCGKVLKGVLKPPKCRLFGKECSPENPVGALMVSSEGACAAYHQYVHRQSEAAD
jgi:hydrogenase expression/formation protein HypD